MTTSKKTSTRLTNGRFKSAKKVSTSKNTKTPTPEISVAPTTESQSATFPVPQPAYSSSPFDGPNVDVPPPPPTSINSRHRTTAQKRATRVYRSRLIENKNLVEALGRKIIELEDDNTFLKRQLRIMQTGFDQHEERLNKLEM